MLLLIVVGLGLAPRAAAADGPQQLQPPGPLHLTALGRLAAQLRPGQFLPFAASLPAGVPSLAALLAGQRPDGSRAPAIDTWTDSAQWDGERQRAFFQGLRQSNRFLVYSAQGHRWDEIGLDDPQAPPKFERFGHLYGRTALDVKRGHFYRLAGNTLHRFHVDEGHWGRVEGAPLGGYISIDWHEGLDMLVGLAKNELHGFRDGAWHRLGRAAVEGYHSSARFNRTRGDMLFIGGNHSRNQVSLLTADGTVLPRQPAPFNFGISSDDLAYDPVSGHYLVLHREGVLWEYAPDADRWRVARRRGDGQGDWPFRSEGIVPIVVDELGVVLWNSAGAPVLYRHRSVFGTGAVPASADGNEASSPAGRLRVLPAAENLVLAVSSAAAPTPVSASAPAARRMPAAPEAKVVVPPVAPSLGNGLLAREVATMEPGQWRHLADHTTWEGKDSGRSFKSFQSVKPLDGSKGGADGMGWTQSLVHHQGRLMLLMMRDHFERALLVMEADGRFHRLNQPPGFEQTTHRRPFNKLTQDDRYLYYSPNIGRSKLGQMIRTPLHQPGVFEPYGIPIGDSQIVGQFAATYVPEWGRFYAYTSGGKLWSWAEGEPRWTRHAELPADDNGHRLSGYAGLLLWNSVRRELAIVGGQTFGKNPSTSHKVYRITEPLGAPQMLPDRMGPDGSLMPWGSGTSRMLVDPRDGSYLLLTKDAVYRNHCAGGMFSLYQDLRTTQPFGHYEPYTPLIVLPGTDVVVFVSHIKGLVLHRLRPAAAPADAQPPCPGG